MTIKLLATATVGLVVLTGALPASGANYTITVDASRQTAGNPRFWATSVGTGTASLTLRSDLQTHYKIGNRELGFQRVRGHGVLNDDMGIYKGPGSYDWTKFDTYLQAIALAGMRPLVELSFMPKALAASGNDRNPPGNYANYKAFITAVVQHCVDKYGMADVSQWYWEVWNEPDYAGFWTGTMADYYTLYDNAVDAITAVIPNANVGGPSTTEPGKIAAFLQHCKSANKRVTFVSSHVYPGGAAAGTSANATSLVNDNNTRLSQITSGGYTTTAVKSLNTEWNSSYNGQGGLTGDVVTSMDNHWNVGFILKGVKLLSDKNSGETPPLDVFSYWVLSDVFDESNGPSGSYILGQNNGNLPFGRVFGLMTFQGMRKAAFNAFKMLYLLGPKRLMSGGGTGNDGVDAMATLSANSDELQILVYNTASAFATTGSDMVTVNVSNLPAALAGKELFVTHFRADETHSNPYNAWVAAGRPGNPTEAQWQAMKAHQHLALLSPVSKATVTTSYTTSFTIPRHAGSLILLGVKRPVTGRNAFVEIEAEDYDGQTGITKPDSGDTTTLGQAITGGSGASAYYLVTDFSDSGANAVQLRVNTSAATTLELRVDSATAAPIGTCQIASTSGAWATQTCNLTATAGVHTLYVSFGGTVRLNHFKFQAAPSTTGTGGAGGGGAVGCVAYPNLPGATRSTLYTVTANGTALFVERMTKFSPEMQVHYAHCTLSGAGTPTFAVTVGESFTSHTLSPKSRNIATTKSGNTVTFASGPNYLILQVDAKELLFILIDAPESNPPRLGDANVKNIADYTVDNTGATLVTAKVQSAINAASGATQNILYFPPGKYLVGELWMKSNMTIYLAGGAILYGSNTTGDFNTGSGGIDIEGCSHGMIRMYQIQNAKVLGRGVIDGNGKSIRAQNDTKINLFKIEQSSNIVIDGVLVRDPSFWNTLIYRSDMVIVQNYKMVNCRPTTTTYNNTDGVNFDESTNGRLTNAFLYTGDDNMAVKNEEPSGTINTKNVLHEKVVCYSNSVCAKVGTKTMGTSMDGVVFRDIDVVKAGRALNIDAYDTAIVQNTRYENIRIEAADSSMIDLSSDMPPTWRTAANTSVIKDTYFTNVASDVKKSITLHGKSATVNITGVHFDNVTVQGRAITSQTDADATWNINSYVSGITFQ